MMKQYHEYQVVQIIPVSPNMAVAKLALFLVAVLCYIEDTKSENTFVIAPIPGNLLAKFQGK